MRARHPEVPVDQKSDLPSLKEPILILSLSFFQEIIFLTLEPWIIFFNLASRVSKFRYTRPAMGQQCLKIVDRIGKLDFSDPRHGFHEMI